MLDPVAPKTLLVYATAEITGDGLIKLPFVAGLRKAFPNTKITWCSASGNSVYGSTLKDVVAPHLDEVWLDAKPNGLGAFDLFHPSPLNGRRFDLVIDTQENVRRSLFLRRVTTGGFISSAMKFALSTVKPRTAFPEGMVERLGFLLKLAAGPGAGLEPLRVENQRAQAAAEWLLPMGPTYVGFAPGAGDDRRRWPLENYIALARQKAALGYCPVFLIGPREYEFVDLIRSQVPGVLMPQLDRTDAFQDVDGLLLAVALAGRLTAGVANDAGQGHILGAANVPMLSLQITRRKAVKFKPASSELEILVAEDFGGQMEQIPFDLANERFDALLSRL